MSTGNEPPVPAEDDTLGPATGTPSPLHGKNRTRDGNGHFERSVETVARDAHAAELRARGWKLQEIADELGYTDRSNVRRAIQRTHRDVAQGPADRMLTLYAERLEGIFQRTMDIAEEDHVVVSHGKIITDGDGTPLRDHGAVLAAFREARAALADVRKMLGLDQPTKVDARITEVTQQDIELQEMLSEARATVQAEEQGIVDGGS